MRQDMFAQWLRARRLALSMTQETLAQRVGTTRSNISAMESGTRAASPQMQRKLRRALAHYPSVVLDRNRETVLAIAARHGITNVRVFGSCARGDDRLDSDIDLLVTMPHNHSMISHVPFQDEVTRLLATRVDVMSDPDRRFDSIAGRALTQARREALSLA